MSKTKRQSLALLAIAGLLILLLAMSLPSLGLTDGTPFSLDKSEVSMPGVSDPIPGTDAFGWLVRGLIALAIVVLPVYILYSMLTAEGRRRLLMYLLLFAVLFGILVYLDQNPLSEGELGSDMMGGSTSEEMEEAPEPPPSTFEASEPPGWLVAALIVVAAAIAVSLLAAGLWVFQQRRARGEAGLRPLARAAQQTLESLQAGGDFATAIMRCYYDMTRIVKEHRGIARDAAQTPREFEVYLANRGLPREAVETLTRLFEQVRYGSITPRPDDEALAVTSLTEIIKACQPLRGETSEH